MSPGPGGLADPGGPGDSDVAAGAGWVRFAAEIAVVLADDHRIVRAGVRLLLDAERGMRVVAEAGDVADLQRMVAAHRPDVVVLAAEMPGGSSLPAIPVIRRRSPDTRVVVLTTHDEPELVRTARRLGASALVTTRAEADRLIDAIRAAAAEARPAERAFAAPSSPGEGAPDGLSPRELEVLRLIALGHTNGEIAGRLFLSVRTVESHRAHIQRKTGRGPRAELVAYARERGIG